MGRDRPISDPVAAALLVEHAGRGIDLDLLACDLFRDRTGRVHSAQGCRYALSAATRDRVPDVVGVPDVLDGALRSCPCVVDLWFGDTTLAGWVDRVEERLALEDRLAAPDLSTVAGLTALARSLDLVPAPRTPLARWDARISARADELRDELRTRAELLSVELRTELARTQLAPPSLDDPAYAAARPTMLAALEAGARAAALDQRRALAALRLERWTPQLQLGVTATAELNLLLVAGFLRRGHAVLPLIAVAFLRAFYPTTLGPSVVLEASDTTEVLDTAAALHGELRATRDTSSPQDEAALLAHALDLARAL